MTDGAGGRSRRPSPVAPDGPARSAAKIERYEKALREIGLPEHVPQGFDPLDWWRFKACKRGEIARDALGVTAEDLIRDQWEEGVPHV